MNRFFLVFILLFFLITGAPLFNSFDAYSYPFTPFGFIKNQAHQTIVVDPNDPAPVTTNLTIHLDAQKSATIQPNVSSSITGWQNFANTSEVFTKVAGNTAVITTFDTKPYVDVTSAFGFGYSGKVLTRGMTLFAVVRLPTTFPAWGCIFSHGSRDNDISLRRYNSIIPERIAFYTSADDSTCMINYSTNTPILFVGTLSNDGSGSATAISRTFKAYTTSGVTTSTCSLQNHTMSIGSNRDLRVGTADNTGDYGRGYIGEILYYTYSDGSVMSESNISTMVTFLKAKWGI